MNIKEFEEKIVEIRNNISNIDFKKIEHNILVSFVQDYVNFQIAFLGIETEEMGNYSIIKREMVFYPPNYDKCVQKIFNMYSRARAQILVVTVNLPLPAFGSSKKNCTG